MYKILVGRSEKNRPLCRPRLSWKDGINLDLKKYDVIVWNEFIWFRVGTSDRLL
jgi:hypothetical protein